MLIVGTSNISDINEDRITRSSKNQKLIAYTLDKTHGTIVNFNDYVPDVIVLHSLTNDVRNNIPEQCLVKLDQIIKTIEGKCPSS